MIYDSIIIGGGASGLFCSIFLPKEEKKAILEKTNTLAQKVLLSGGERCNFSNTNISPENYFGTNKKMLPSVFHKFSSDDMEQLLHNHGIASTIEAGGRKLLKSGKSKEIKEFLIEKSLNNTTEIHQGQTIEKIEKTEEGFLITTPETTRTTKKLIIATGGKSFGQLGATDIARTIAQQFGIQTKDPYPGLCGIETTESTTDLTGNSFHGKHQVRHNNKCIYEETGNILFTHRGISGPSTFNITLALGNHGKPTTEYIIKSTPDNDTIKKILTHFNINPKNPEILLHCKSIRPREEAKVTGGGILLSELKPNFETKKIPGLYFLGETIDITGKTGGFNLQRARSSAYACATSH